MNKWNNKSIWLFAVLGFFLWGKSNAQVTIEKSKHNIVMQLTSNNAKVHKGLTKQLKNLKDGYGEDVAIEVVCHGPGIDFMRKGITQYSDQIANLKARGIVFVVCENSLKGRKVPRSEILEGYSFVKMGIGEIVKKQEAGWSYIKAGF